jgi:penicillin amidase
MLVHSRRFAWSIGLALCLAGLTAHAIPSTNVFLEGVEEPASAVFSQHDVATICAQNEHDAIFVQGYLHARDRFFQMDFQRRAFSGTLAEMFGPGPDADGDGVGDVLAQDVQLRTLGLKRAAEASLPVQTPETMAWLSAYAEGVNAYLASGPLPPEYGALELSSVPPWTELDSLVVAKGLAFSLSFDLEDIDRTLAFLAFDAVGSQAGFSGILLFFQDLYRAAPFDPSISITDPQPLTATGDDGMPTEMPYYYDLGTQGLLQDYHDTVSQIPILNRALSLSDNPGGSNWFIAAGALTDSGFPMFANDPHLALDTPATFYEVHLNVEGSLNVAGVSFPGAPGIVQGCNDVMCWGTSVNPLDVTDVYQEVLLAIPDPNLPPGTLNYTVFDGVPEPMLLIPQQFFVNIIGDGNFDNLVDAGVPPDAGGVTLVVPRRNNGPIVNIDDDDPALITGLSVQYTGWGPTQELEAFRQIAKAESVDAFRDALQFFDVGSQNFGYADINGNIAYFTSAELPIREDFQNLQGPAGFIAPFLIRDGTHTLPHEWLEIQNPQPHQALNREILPFDEMPQIVNPSTGYILNGNNDPVGTTIDNVSFNQLRPGGGVYYLSPGYATGFRMGRLQRLFDDALAGGSTLTFEQFREFQGNNQLLDAEVLTPFLLTAWDNATAEGAPPELTGYAADPRLQEAAARLAAWDFSTPTGIPEGYDPGDDPQALPDPSQAEIDASVAATIYSAWRGQVVQRVIDGTMSVFPISAEETLADLTPGSSQAMAALRNFLDIYPSRHGIGLSGLNFFFSPGIADQEVSRDNILLEALGNALDLLASDEFGPAFGNSTNQDDYRWGKLHRITFDHPLGPPFNIPPSGGLSDLGPDLPGVARAGGLGAVDASTHSARADGLNEFTFDSGPNRRLLATLAPTGPEAREVIPGGQSGVIGSPFQSDQLQLWLVNDEHDLPIDKDDAIAQAVREEVYKAGCPEEPDPQSQGYWHRQCLGLPASEGGIDPGRNGRGPQSPTEPGFADELRACADARLEDLGFYGETTCSGMDADPANDAGEKALKQLTALILNVCSERLGDFCDIDVSAYGCSSTTVGDLIDEATGLIQSGSANEAKDCLAAVNEGAGLVPGGADWAQPAPPKQRKIAADAKQQPGGSSNFGLRK